MSKLSTADALLTVCISPNVPDANLEPANLVDAIVKIADSIRYGLKWLGTGDAATCMGAIECHAKAVLDAGNVIACAIGELADAIRER